MSSAVNGVPAALLPAPVLLGFGVLVLLSIALALHRLLTGPTQTDRVLALDILFAAALALALAVSLHTGRTVFLDVACGLALVGFVATLGWARLIDRSAAPPPAAQGEPEGGAAAPGEGP